MSRKSNDAPLKLIQLVPSQGSERKVISRNSEPETRRLRLQIGIEGEPSWGMRILGAVSRLWTGNNPQFSDEPYRNPEVSAPSKPFILIRVGQTILAALSSIGRPILAAFIWTKNKVGHVGSGIGHAVKNLSSRNDDEEFDIPLRRGGTKIASPEPAGSVEMEPLQDSLVGELQTLREELNAQQYELSRVNNQVADLKSRVTAQQKMILGLAEELDAVALEACSSSRGNANPSEVGQSH